MATNALDGLDADAEIRRLMANNLGSNEDDELVIFDTDDEAEASKVRAIIAHLPLLSCSTTC